MPIKKKRCQVCRRWFIPDPRTSHQVCCDKPECRKRRKAAANKKWRLDNPRYDKSRAGKKRAWARGRDYWRNYRRTHPNYAARDNKRRSKARRSRKCAANQAMRRKIAVGKLESLRNITPDSAANQDVIARRMEVLVEYLFPQERAANQIHTDSGPASGP
jgi:hypothetical protein